MGMKIKDFATASRFILLSIVASEIPKVVTMAGQITTQAIVFINANRISGSFTALV